MHYFFLSPIRRQQGGRVHLRHHRSRGRPRGHRRLHPGEPERLWLRQREAGLLQPGRGLEVGRLLCRCPLRPGILQGVCGRAGDQAERQDSHEFTQQRSGTQGTSRVILESDLLDLF